MGRNGRRGLVKVLAATGLAGLVLAGTALAASAMIPKPGTTRIEDGFTFSNLTGYQSPGASGASNCNAYAPNTSFSFSIDVRNGFGSRDQTFSFQVFKMVALSPSVCFTEAQLEHFVAVGQDAGEVQVQDNTTQSFHFDFGTTRTISPTSNAMGCGYYQFDFGTSGHGSMAPKPGVAANDTTPVSGFVLFNGPSCAATSGVSGTTTTTTTTTGTSGASASTARLATTGGGPAAGLELLFLLLLGSVSLMGGVRLLVSGGGRAT
jgi:hypothetical protein